MAQQVMSVSQINGYIRSVIDRETMLSAVAIRGEISNYKIYPSGHHYFTIKDEEASLKCVMFRSSAIRLKFRPENGMKIIALGKISVFPRDGAYQLYCTALALDGIGDLHAAFEQLKTKLADQGLFDPDHKKPLPKYPGTIGIVTSSAGAAIHDMLRILRARYPLTQVILLPVRVQGTEAPGEIVKAIQCANKYKLADLLIVGRGGGSLEDLWAFNDETIAHAIYNSEIPVISAVGHEPDVTISDYVADVRAATPSNAAELAVPDCDALKQTLDSISASMLNALTKQLKASRQHLNVLASSPALCAPERYIRQRYQAFNYLKTRLYSADQRMIANKKQHFVSLTAKLDAMSPLKVLIRGYAMLQSAKGQVIRSVKQVNMGEELLVSLNDGTIRATINEVKENSV